MFKIFLSLSFLYTLSFSSYISLSPISKKPLMTYSNYSEKKPMKLDHFNNNLNFPIIPKKSNLSNYTNSNLQNTKTLPSYYFPIK